jgi:hypothetical protein
MALRKSVYAAAAAIALWGATLFAGAAPASAACRAPVEASARGFLQNATQVFARARWRNEVRGRYGFAFTRWSAGKDKVERCRKLTPGRRWHCTARARPCTN